MEKSDETIHGICIASIKRNTIKPYDFKWSHFWETKSDFENYYQGLVTNFEPEEIPICSTVLDSNNWSVLTTRRLITNKASQLTERNIGDAFQRFPGDFKGLRDKEITMGTLEFKDGRKMEYFVETGRASIIMVYGIQTRIQIGVNI
jgi:hypothetical protein